MTVHVAKTCASACHHLSVLSSICIGVLVMTELNNKWQSLPSVVRQAPKQGETVIVCHMEGRLGLTKASLSVLEGMGGAVLQEVGGLGGHALQHQVQAARVQAAREKRRMTTSTSSIASGPSPPLPLCLHQQCCHTHTHTEAHTHTHIYWLESDSHQVRLSG